MGGPTMDFSEKNNYKPDFKLEYNDDDGKPISAKEAFRILSHKFHGKGSGKNKVDKKRRKIEQEKVIIDIQYIFPHTFLKSQFN